MVRALASHQCGPGSVPGTSVICGMRLLFVLFFAPRGFYISGYSGFPLSPKTNISKFQFDPAMGGHFKRRLVNSVGKQITFFYYSSSRAQTSGGSLRTPAPGPSLVTSNSTSRKTPSSRRTPHISSVTPGMPPSSVVVGKL